MAIKAKPDVYVLTQTGPYNSVCGGTSYRSSKTVSRQAYIDTEYKAKVALGIPKLLMPYGTLTSTWNEQPGIYSGGNGTSLCSPTACFGGVHAASTVKALEKATYNAKQVFFGKLAKQDSLNLAVALAEMKETVGLVASTATRLAVAYSQLRKGQVKNAFRVLGISDTKRVAGLRGVPKNSPSFWTAKHHRKYLENRVPKRDHLSQFAASTWLEITYGWTPLLLDVYGGAQYAAKLLNESSCDLIVKAASRGSHTDTYSDANEESTSVSTAIVKYIVMLKIDDPLIRNLASLGLTNPLLVAWEKVPFSFVVDWFYPVGAALQSITALQGYTVVGSSTSTKITTDTTFMSKHKDFPCSGNGTSSEFSRVLGGVPSATMPKLDLPNLLSWKKAASALSLLKVVFLNKH